MPADLAPSPRGRRRVSRAAWLVLACLLLLAFNLRIAAMSVNPVLGTLQRDLHMRPVATGILTSLPVVCFASVGALAPGLARRVGLHRTIIAALFAIVAGQLARTTAHTSVPFLVLSACALAGMAMANVLLPSLVKLHFPRRIGTITALYSLTMSLGVTLTSAFTVPLAHSLGSWRHAFLFGAAAAVIALVPWLALGARQRPSGEQQRSTAPISLARVARTKLGWTMAIFFGFQSMIAYSVLGWLPSIFQSAGFSETTSGLLLGLTTGVGVPLAFLIPAYTARVHSPHRLLLGINASGVAGLLGLLLAPTAVPWLWTILIAVGTSSFPMILALMGLRARTSEGTAALSGFTQSVGYLVAAVGPFLVGTIHEVTGGWTWSIVTMMLMLGPLTGAGLLACRPQWLEDEWQQTGQVSGP